MTCSALSPRGLFFRNAQVLIPSPPIVIGHDAVWWTVAILIAWCITSILFGAVVWPLVAKWFLGEPTTLNEEAEALHLNAVERWFKKNHRKNKSSTPNR